MHLISTALSSSVISAVWYAPDYEALVVRFQTGSVWLYTGVPEDIFYQLVAAESAGGFFNNNIRSLYPAKKYFNPDEAKQFFDE